MTTIGPGMDGDRDHRLDDRRGPALVGYGDGTTQDAGAAARSPAGRDGSPAALQTLTTEDGTIHDCPRSGGSDTAPVHTCSVRP